MRICEVCETTNNVELHHVVFKSQSMIMRNMPINFKYLCSRCHRGKNGPHRNKKVDNLYKKEVQNKIEKILYKDYYTAEELKKALKIKNNQFRYIEKNCELTNRGYESEKVIRYMMGGRLYD